MTAILSTFDGKLQLKPFTLEQFEVVKQAVRKEDTTLVGKVVKIGDIQGTHHTSPLLKKAVTVEQVVVTYLEDSTHFYVQDLNGDGNVATSDGIRVFAKSAKVAVGDVLTISGEVEEFLVVDMRNVNKRTLQLPKLWLKLLPKQERLQYQPLLC